MLNATYDSSFLPFRTFETSLARKTLKTKDDPNQKAPIKKTSWQLGYLTMNYPEKHKAVIHKYTSLFIRNVY